ncbi:alanine and glycine-rich protein-like [Panicum hallii]|uniref:alanine and glycine-rich protein-like n=1 Tax=Panicum hallii TaxID=206008 RepID=UPI000DF4F082|nr:alanine and glycine-rich protein-like [Panicum hallii]
MERRAHGGAEEVLRRSNAEGVLGFGGAAKDRDRNAGGFGGPTYGAAEPSACGPSVERSPGISGSGAEGDFSTSEKEVNNASTKEDSAVGGFLRGGSSEDDEDDDDEEIEGGSGYSGDSGGDDGSSDNDSSYDDSDIGATPLIKRRKVLGTYWW